MQVNPELKSHFEEKGFRFVGQDVEGERMEVIELDGMETELFFIFWISFTVGARISATFSLLYI